jgi:hypothetical protein
MACGRSSRRLFRRRALFPILVLVVSCGWPTGASAAPTVESIRVGIAGLYRPDRWCPVEVRIGDVATDGDYRVAIDCVDAAGQRIRHVGIHRLRSQAANRVVQLIRLGRLSKPIGVSIRNLDGEPIAHREFDRAEVSEPIADDEQLVVVIGRLTGLEAVEALNLAQTKRNRYQQIAGLSQLPISGAGSLTDRSLAFDAVTTIVWMVGQSTSSGDPIDAQSLQTLDDWVRGGGRLVLSLGPDAQRELAGTDLAQALNLGTPAESTELRQPAPLESFIGIDVAASTGPRHATSQERPFRLRVARLDPLEGTVAASLRQSDRNLPLVAEIPHGFGQVTVVAFDLNDPTLATWPGHTRLVAKILALGETDPARGDIAKDSSSDWSGKGYASVSEQLADALDQFPGTSPERFWYLVAAVIGYVLVVGPIDWYLVRRKPEWTWATFLATVVLAAGGAYALVHFTKSDAVLASSLCLMDVDLTTDATLAAEQSIARVRGTTWASVYQPRAGIVDLAIAPMSVWNSATTQSNGTFDSARTRLSLWSRTSAGGPSPTSMLAADRNPLRASYDTERGRINALSLSAWSSQLLAAKWFGEYSRPQVATLVPDAFGRVVGAVRNPLDEPLEHCVVFYGVNGLLLGNLKAGQEINVDGRGDWRSIEAHLTRQSFVQDHETAEKYDPTSTDLSRIGEVLGFFDAAGGRRYTRLDNRGVDAGDLSNQLRLGRAVLIGRTGTGPAVELSPDVPAQPHRQTTWWRFLLRPTATPGSGR